MSTPVSTSGIDPHPSCPVCTDVARPSGIQKDEFRVYHCDGCTHRFVNLATSPAHVETIYDDSYFFGGGDGYPNYLELEAVVAAHARQYTQLTESLLGDAIRERLGHPVVGQRPRMLDVGAAAGFTMSSFAKAGWTTLGVEPNDSMARFGRDKLNLDIHTGPLENLPSVEPVDLVAMIQVLPHLYDLHAALSRAREVTRPGGHWLIETWNHRSLTARVTGRNWHEYSPPSVLHFFSPDSLIKLAADYGMSLVQQGRPRKRVTGAHAHSLLRHKFGLLSLPSRIIPARAVLPYPAEDLFWMVFSRD